MTFLFINKICEISSGFYLQKIINAHSELWKVLFFGAVSLWLFVYEISLEPLNGFVPNSHGRRVWSLAQTSLKVKVKGQRHQGQIMAFFGPFSGLCVVYVW